MSEAQEYKIILGTEVGVGTRRGSDTDTDNLEMAEAYVEGRVAEIRSECRLGEKCGAIVVHKEFGGGRIARADLFNAGCTNDACPLAVDFSEL